MASLLERDMVVKEEDWGELGLGFVVLYTRPASRLLSTSSTAWMEPASNTLGLDFDQLKITESSSPPSNDVPVADKGNDSPDNEHAGKQEKKKPYINPERVKTGGAQRVRMDRL